MSDENPYTSNPLHGVGLKTVLTEIVDHYGFEMLFAYLNINCFQNNPSIDSSAKFLKKTDWARVRVEAFYLYKFKNLPRASAAQFLLPPRERVIPVNQTPGAPAVLSLEDAERLREKREKEVAAYGKDVGHRAKSGKSFDAPRRRASSMTKSNYQNRFQNDERAASDSTETPTKEKVDPWANWKNKA